VWTCEICVKHVLLWSSPSSHTVDLVALISRIGCCGSPYVSCYSGCYGVFISVKGDGLRDESEFWYHT